MNRVIITGLPRSGTKYVATVLTKAGVPCGHEQLYNELSALPQVIKPVECSWLAAPYTADHTSHIITLHRNPHLVRCSIWKCGLFTAPNAWQDYAVQFCPDIAKADSPERKADIFMVEWPRLIQHSLLTISVETFGIEHIALVAGLAGLPFDITAAKAALANTPKDTNHR